MTMPGWIASYTAMALDAVERVVAQAGRKTRRRALRSTWVLVAAAAFVFAACGSMPAARTSAQSSIPTATLPSVPASNQPSSSPPVATASGAVKAQPRRSRIDGIVEIAKGSYHSETKGRVLRQQLNRIARDSVLLNALSRGDVAGAQAAADAQLKSPANHFDHVTRIGVIRGARVLVNATVNSNGVFVVAPGIRTLRLRGRVLGTLLVSIQDITGYVKVVHDLTGAGVVARGAGGRVRASVGTPAGLRLPPSGYVTIAGRRYAVRSFHELGWGKEQLTVWVLAKA